MLNQNQRLVKSIENRFTVCRELFSKLQNELFELEKEFSVLRATNDITPDKTNTNEYDKIIDDIRKDILPDWQRNVVTVYSCPDIYPINTPNIFMDTESTGCEGEPL